MKRRFIHDESGSGAAEFAIVLPLLLLFLLGIIDVGRLMWTYNRAEKAAQMGARFAAVTDMIPATLKTRDFALQNGVPGGNPVPTSLFSTTTCDTSGCSNSWGYDAAAFSNVVTRMRFMMPEISASNVQIQYDNVGLGYAGDPNGPDVSPLITVTVSNIPFRPLTFRLLGGVFNLAPVTASLTGEDMDGTISN
jgi:Flp pilus assembly protein TadG